MSGESSINQELLKRVYVDPVQNAVVLTNYLRNAIKFDGDNRTGDEYRAAIMLRRPQGFTFAMDELMQSSFQVNSAIGGLTKQVAVKPGAILLEDTISYSFSSSMQSEQAAFNPQLALVFTSMVESHDQQFEQNNLYGGTNIGVGNTGSQSGLAVTSQISKASWSPHLFAPMEGGRLDAYADSGLTSKITSDGAAILTSVDIDNRTLVVTYASNANAVAAAAAGAGGNLYFVPYQGVGNIPYGLWTLLTRSAAGSTVFGIDTSLYAYARASTYDAASGPMTFTKLANAAIGPAAKGGMGDLECSVNLYSWTDIMNNQAALRRFVDKNGGEFENGADKLIYHGANGGRLVVGCNPMLKASEGTITDWDDWRWIGSTMPTFNLPGQNPANPKLAFELPGNAGWGVRRWSQAAPFCRRLARQSRIINIVNDSGPTGGGT